MKKLLTLTIAMFFFVGLFAQDPSTVVLLNYSTIKKKVEKSNVDIQNEKKNVKPATWAKRGELFQDVFLVGLDQIQEGMSTMTVTLFYKEPNEIQTETKDGITYETYIYDNIKYVFANGGFQSWTKIDPIDPDPLKVAMDSYFKTIELDVNGKLSEKVKENLIELKNQFKRDGVNSYYIDDYKSALNSFKNVLKINELDIFQGEFDTIMVQYSGIISREIAEKTDDKQLYLDAIDFYQQLADADFGGPNTYLQLKLDWFNYGDTLGGLNALLEGYEKYPDTLNIIANVADTYIVMDSISDGLVFIDRAIENAPEIGESYYWKGRLLINLEEGDRIEEAIEVYKKAGELKPSLYYIWYDLGYIYYLQGADYYERANLEEDDNFRQQLLELGKEKYDLSIPVLEKALQLNEGTNPQVRFETLDLLQRIYYKEQKMDEYNRIKELKAQSAAG